MKNIILFANFDSFGGTRTYFFQLIKYFYENKYNVKVFVREDQIDNKVSEIIDKYNFNICIRPQQTRIYKLFPVSIFLCFLEFMYWKIKYAMKNEIIFMSGLDYIEFFVGLILFNNLNYVVHSYPTGKIRYLTSVSGLIDGKRKRIITVSNFSKQKIIRYFGIKDRDVVKVVYNTVNEFGLVKTLKKNFRKEKVVVSFGHLEWYKNPLFWYEVAKKVVTSLDGVKFYWYGEGSEKESVLKNIISDGLTKRIKIFPFNKNPYGILGSAYIYFQPSMIESFGLSVLEATASGVPCVVSCEGGLPEVVVNKKTGYIFKKFNADKVAKLFIELVRDNHKRDVFGKECKVYYHCKFSNVVWKNNMDYLMKNIC